MKTDLIHESMSFPVLAPAYPTLTESRALALLLQSYQTRQERAQRRRERWQRLKMLPVRLLHRMTGKAQTD
jgi:hypothetical protein